MLQNKRVLPPLTLVLLLLSTLTPEVAITALENYKQQHFTEVYKY